MSMGLSEFLSDFEASEHDRLDEGEGWRNVYALDESYEDELGLDSNMVVKYSDTSTGRAQNRNELRAYLESLERDQDFMPRVVGGSADFEYLVSKRINPLPAPSGGHPWRENPEMEAYAEECRKAIPEGWVDSDDIELGFDDGDVKLLDGGTVRRKKGWIVDDSLEHDSVDSKERNGDYYFTVDI